MINDLSERLAATDKRIQAYFERIEMMKASIISKFTEPGREASILVSGTGNSRAASTGITSNNAQSRPPEQREQHQVYRVGKIDFLRFSEDNVSNFALPMWALLRHWWNLVRKKPSSRLQQYILKENFYSGIKVLQRFKQRKESQYIGRTMSRPYRSVFGTSSLVILC